MILLAAFNKSIAQELQARLAETPSQEERTWSPLQDGIFDNFKNGRGHTVVVARAGTGKTTTIIEAVRRMPQDVEAQTLHSIGFRLLKERVGHLQIDQGGKEEFKELTALTEAFLGKAGVHPEGNLAKFLLNPAVTSKISKVVSWVKGTNPLFRNLEPFQDAAIKEVSDMDLPEGEENECLLAVAKIAMKACLDRLAGFKAKTQRWCSFDDMIWGPVRLQIKLGRSL